MTARPAPDVEDGRLGPVEDTSLLIFGLAEPAVDGQQHRRRLTSDLESGDGHRIWPSAVANRDQGASSATAMASATTSTSRNSGSSTTRSSSSSSRRRW